MLNHDRRKSFLEATERRKVALSLYGKFAGRPTKERLALGEGEINLRSVMTGSIIKWR